MRILILALLLTGCAHIHTSDIAHTADAGTTAYALYAKSGFTEGNPAFADLFSSPYGLAAAWIGGAWLRHEVRKHDQICRPAIAWLTGMSTSAALSNLFTIGTKANVGWATFGVGAAVLAVISYRSNARRECGVRS